MNALVHAFARFCLRCRMHLCLQLTQEFGVPHSEVMKGENKDNLRHVFILGIWPQYSLFTTDIMSMQSARVNEYARMHAYPHASLHVAVCLQI